MYVLSGAGRVGGHDGRDRGGPIAVSVPATCDRRDDADDGPLDVLLLGGKPIREPVFSYGPFVMNTKQEIIEAIDDYEAGKMGAIPPR